MANGDCGNGSDQLPLQWDQLDRQIVERLQYDGRETNRSLATALGVSEVTVASRLRRLEVTNAMRVVALTDIHGLGFEYFAFAMITVSNRPMTDVAAQIARIPQTTTVTVHSGRYGIICAVLARNRIELGRIIGEAIPSVDGVSAVHCELAIDVLRYSSRWATLVEGKKARGNLPQPELPTDILDGIDLRIVEALQRDARTSNRNIAAEIGVSESTIRKRLRRMEAHNLLRIRAVSDITAFGTNVYAIVGVHVLKGRVDEAQHELQRIDGVTALIRTVGEFDFVLSLMRPTREALSASITKEMQALPSIRGTEAFESIATPKHLYTWVRLVGEQVGEKKRRRTQ